MCEIMEKIEAEGFARGIAQGITQGIADATRKIIQNQLKRHAPYEQIAEDTETTVEEVIRIAKESNLSY